MKWLQADAQSHIDLAHALGIHRTIDRWGNGATLEELRVQEVPLEMPPTWDP